MEYEGQGNTSCNDGLGIVPNSLEKGLEELKINGKIKTIQISVLLRLARILRRVLET